MQRANNGTGRFRDRGSSWNVEYNGQSKTFPKKQYPTKTAARIAAGVWIEEIENAASKAAAIERIQNPLSPWIILDHTCDLDILEAFNALMKTNQYDILSMLLQKKVDTKIKQEDANNAN